MYHNNIIIVLYLVHMSKLFIVFREIEDEEPSDTDEEVVEDGTFLPDAESDDDD